MKFLMLTWNYPPTVGGIEQVAYQMATGLERHGHRVDVVTAALPAGRNAPAQGIARARRKGVPVFLCHAIITGWRHVRHNRPDVILCPSLTSAPAAWWVGKATGLPYVILIHGSDILVPSRAYQWAIRPLLSGAQRLFANSQNTADLLKTRGLDPDRIRVVCPGVTPPPPPSEKPSDSLLRLLAETTGRPTLVTVGRLIRRKGIKEFIECVMPRLIQRYPDLLYLVVGGEAKASLIHQERILDQLQRSILETGVANQVRLIGRLSDADLERVYKRADVFVLPCLDDPNDVEGFGIVILEAALRGVPAVATRCGGIPDAIVDGQTGILVPPGNAEAMAAAILDTLDHPDKRGQLGEQARQRTNRDFTWDQIAGQYAYHLASIRPSG